MNDVTTASRPPLDLAKIAGWGVDADPQNDPTYPYRDRTQDEEKSVMDWTPPPRQPEQVEVLQSIEYLRRPAVFGSSTPPSWVSGSIRRLAFRWSESHWLHWLMLMGADRINVVEGVVQDLGRGKIPNIPAEMGAGAEWKHNRKGFVTKAAVTLALTAGVVALIRSRRNGRGDESGWE